MRDGEGEELARLRDFDLGAFPLKCSTNTLKNLDSFIFSDWS